MKITLRFSLTTLLFCCISLPVLAQECFIGEIRMFGGNFAPRGWALLDGQLLPISTNQALFSILGTTYGGDGRTTFALPDMRGRLSMHAGHGPGLVDRRLGEKTGTETNTLAVSQLPPHNHSLNATTASGNNSSPTGRALSNDGNDRIYSNQAPNVSMHAGAIGNTGGGIPVNNIPPIQVVNYIMCLQGIYPSRN